MLLLKKQHTLIEFTLIDIPPGIWFSLKIKTILKRMLSMIWTDYYHQNSKDNSTITANYNVFWYSTLYDITDLAPYSTILQFPWGHILYILLFCWKPYFFLGVVYIYSRKSNTDLYNLSSSNIGKRIHSVSNTKWKKSTYFNFCKKM